jgi:Tfp pilus assembly protein PilV
MKKNRLNNKGLSLVEVVMAALLISVVLAALFATFRNANNLIGLSKSKLVALNWAQSVIENERADFRGAYTNPATPNWLTVSKGAGPPAINRPNRGADMQEVIVTITWTE